MKKYIITWNAGYGPESDVIEAESMEKAEEEAYMAWKESAELNADYEAMEWTQELEDEYL